MNIHSGGASMLTKRWEYETKAQRRGNSIFIMYIFSTKIVLGNSISVHRIFAHDPSELNEI